MIQLLIDHVLTEMRTPEDFGLQARWLSDPFRSDADLTAEQAQAALDAGTP